jgi:hypothetical protein
MDKILLSVGAHQVLSEVVREILHLSY